MGCGPSSPDGKPIVVNIPTLPGEVRLQDERIPNGHVMSSTASYAANQNARGGAEDAWQETDSISSKSSSPQMNAHQPIAGTKAYGSKSVAFEVNLDSNCNNVVLDSKKMPKRLKSKLVPLVNAPKLTADMLAEQQRVVEQNRLQELEKKKESSRQSSRLRKNILHARQFEAQQEKANGVVKLEEKQLSAERNRESRLAAHAEKKLIREERARRAKFRAKQKQMEEKGGDLGFELEKDDAFNDDADSWLADDDDLTRFHTDVGERLFSPSRPQCGASGTERVTTGTQRVTSGTERIYSGRESPAKKFNPRSSVETRARLSAGSTDSFDYAFERVPPVGNNSNTDAQTAQDDFFDT